MKRIRVRELGVSIGKLPTGDKNCLTDVKGVHVGHVTLKKALDDEEYICSGVTAILPHAENIFKQKVIAASHVINGFGKTTGLVQVDELGLIESPILLTNTLAVPAVTQGTLQYMLEHNPEIGDTTGTINCVVGECNDSYLNSIRSLPVHPAHAIQAINKASTKKIEEGAIGAGAGMVCFGYKGGIGTSSRVVSDQNEDRTYTLGCLVLSNFGKRDEIRQWQYCKSQDQQQPINDTGIKGGTGNTINGSSSPNENETPEASDGSIMIVIATDAPLSDRQLKRIAKRTFVGLGRTGSHASHGSGDIAIAFSTAQHSPHFTTEATESRVQLREDQPVMNQLFQAAAEATEEAILNSLTKATTTTGRRGRVVEAIPYDLFN